MPIVRLDQQYKRTRFDAFDLENEIVFTFFEKIPAEHRDETLFRAIYIGVLALMEDRLATFLARTQSELGAQLESLKLIFEMKREIFLKSPAKGVAGEELIADVLETFFKDKRLRDSLRLTGASQGALPRNKTGDILCLVEGNEDKRIVIECKFDRSVRLGDIAERDPFGRKADTAWSQLIEAQVNREAAVALIVFDSSSVDKGLSEFIDNVRYVPAVGFLALVDSQRGDFRNLFVAYVLARDIVLRPRQVQVDSSMLDVLVKRLIRDLDVFETVKSLVERNIETNVEILKQLQRSFLMVKFCQEYLEKFLSEGQLSPDDLLAFYRADDVAERYKLVEKEILDMAVR